MTDELDTTVAPSAIERAMAIFENFEQRDYAPARPGTQGAHRPHLRSNGRRRAAMKCLKLRAMGNGMKPDDAATPRQRGRHTPWLS
jgi:hypothetical protein